MNVPVGLSRRLPVAVIAAAVTISAAGAATLHRFSVSQTTGSEGAQTFLQSTAKASALQGEVGGASANTGLKIPFGTLGEYDPAGSTFGIGLLGVSTTGYAVAGESLSGTQPSVLGYAGSSGPGVEGITNSTNMGAITTSAVYGDATGIGAGGSFEAENGGAAVIGESDYTTAGADIGGFGVLGDPNGVGVVAEGYSGNSTYPALTAYDGVGGSDLIGAYVCAPDSSSDCTSPESFIVQSGSANRSGGTTPFYAGASDTQVSGDLYVYGHVFENCDQFPATVDTRCDDSDTGTTSGSAVVTRSAGGTNVKVYTPKQSVSTVEDFGQAQLVNGRAYVNLDPAFARTTAPGAPYLVFVTPSGDSHSLYVTKRTMSGFEVHESEGGRSTMSIDYRIVAKPLGDTSQRFVAVNPKHRIPGYNMQKNTLARTLKASFQHRHNTKLIAPITLAH